MYILFSALTIMYVYPRITRRLSVRLIIPCIITCCCLFNCISIFFSQKVLRIKTVTDTRWITITSIAGGRYKCNWQCIRKSKKITYRANMFFNDDKSTVGSITRGVHKNLLTVHAWRYIIFLRCTRWCAKRSLTNTITWIRGIISTAVCGQCNWALLKKTVFSDIFA